MNLLVLARIDLISAHMLTTVVCHDMLRSQLVIWVHFRRCLTLVEQAHIVSCGDSMGATCVAQTTFKIIMQSGGTVTIWLSCEILHRHISCYILTRPSHKARCIKQSLLF